MEKISSTILTVSQKESIEKLKNHLKIKEGRTDPFICDHFIQRFLVAYRWDRKKTGKKLKKYFSFREEMLGRLKEFKERKGYPKQNSTTRATAAPTRDTISKPTKGAKTVCDLIRRIPVKIQRYSEIDIKFLKDMSKEELKLMFFVTGERDQNFLYPALSRHYGRRIDQSLVIFDFKGINLAKTYVKLSKILKLSSKVLSDNYPESLYKLILLNTGTTGAVTGRQTLQGRVQAGRDLVGQRDKEENTRRERERTEAALAVHFG